MSAMQNTSQSKAETILGNEVKRRLENLQKTNYAHGGEHVATSLFQSASTYQYKGSRILRQIIGHRVFLANERREFGGRPEVLKNGRYALREFVGFSIRTGLIKLSAKY